MTYDEWRDKYNNYKYIEIMKYLSEKHIDTARKLGIEIENELYTQRELEALHLELSAYYKDEDITKEELELLKSLDATGVTEQELNDLVNKIEEIISQYKKSKYKENKFMISDKELDFRIKQLRNKLRAECKLSDEAKQRIIAKLDKKLKND